ncbi:MAG: 23S rRNA (guanosine(2251)-2'-O)-methyltransferase RlmB [Coriobacteriia bacterium]|nr:23S rRNA (guanosine(2251)-2'-O)-methyltransferase RlmB [Coriobacteriia bacterium]
MSLYIEGRNAVIEALRSGIPGRRILVAEGVQDADAIREIERLATSRGLAIKYVPRRLLDERSERGAHQGVAFEAEEYRYVDLATVLGSIADAPDSLIIALDHVTDPGNLGAVVRTAEVAGADAVLVPKKRTAAIGPAAYKTSAGALAWIPVVRDNLATSLERLKEAGYWVAGADGAAPALAWDTPLEGRLVIVLGAEGQGLSRLVRERCDFLVRLPVAGKVDSLNVAQATSVLAFEWVRRTRSKT